MSAFSFETYNDRRKQGQLRNLSVVQVGTHHPLNNPNRPEFMTSGSIARALFRHAYGNLTGQIGNPATYWNALLEEASKASRDKDQEQRRDYDRMKEVVVAMSATDDDITPEQLEGGYLSAMARQSIYAEVSDQFSRAEKLTIVNHLTTRALGEATGNAGEARSRRDAVGREADRIADTANYKMLAASITQIWDTTRPAPIDDRAVDFDNLDDAGVVEQAETAEATRLRKTRNVVQSFADSYLLDQVDQASSLGRDERGIESAAVVMETAEEAQVIKALLGWANRKSLETDGALPSKEDIVKELRSGENSVYKDLSEVKVQVVNFRTPQSNAGVKGLKVLANPNYLDEQRAAINADASLTPEKRQDRLEQLTKDYKDVLSNGDVRKMLNAKLSEEVGTLNKLTAEENRLKAENPELDASLTTRERTGLTRDDVTELRKAIRSVRDDNGQWTDKPVRHTAEVAKLASLYLADLSFDTSKQARPGGEWVKFGNYTTKQSPLFSGVEQAENVDRTYDRSNQFSALRATLIDGTAFYKNPDAIKARVGELHADNETIQRAGRERNPIMDGDSRLYPSAILIGRNEGQKMGGHSAPLRAVLEKADELGMPVVNLTVSYNRATLRESNPEGGDDRRIYKNDLSYIVSKPAMDNKGQPILDEEGKATMVSADLMSRDRLERERARNWMQGAVVIVEGRANFPGTKEINESQGQMIRWQAMVDMARNVEVFGYGTGSGAKDYNANQLIRMAADQTKLREIYDDSGKKLDSHFTAYQLAKKIANNKVETAMKAHDLLNPGENRKSKDNNRYVNQDEKLNTTYARLLLHHMHIGRDNAQLAQVAKVNGTVGDLFKVAEARTTGGKGLENDTREKYLQIAKAIPADTFAMESIEQIRKVGHANFQARTGMANLQGFTLDFDAPAAKSGPVIRLGDRNLDDGTRNVLMVGGDGKPTPAQAKAIDDAVKAVADKGFGVVTLVGPKANTAVIEAALRHDAKLTVVMPHSPMVRASIGDEFNLLNRVADSKNGVIVAKYDLVTGAGRDTVREHNAYKIASDMSEAVIVTKAKESERAVFEAARIGQDRPVATLPAYEVADTGNRLLTVPYESARTMRTIGTAVSASFSSSMNTEADANRTALRENASVWESKREANPLVNVYERSERSIAWHDPAAHMTSRGTVGSFVESWAEKVATGQERGMVNPEIRTERDLARARGIDTEVKPHALYAQTEGLVTDESDRDIHAVTDYRQVEDRMLEELDRRGREIANSNDRAEPRKVASGGRGIE